MAYTGSDILTEVTRRYADYSRSSEGTVDLQRANDWVLTAVRLYPDASEDLTLTANDDTYAYNINTLAIWQAVYLESSTSTGIVLQPKSVDTLDQDEPTWRTNPAGSPRYFFDRGGEVVLYPKPDTSSSGGYPKVVLYSTRKQTLSDVTSLPESVRQIDAWADYICHLHAKRYAIQDAQGWFEAAMASRQMLIDQLNMVTYRKKAKMRAKYPFVRRV